MGVAKITDGENFRFRVPAELKRAWVEMCKARKISQQDAITALMWFTTSQEPLTQAMLLRQQPAAADLVEVVLKRLSGPTLPPLPPGVRMFGERRAVKPATPPAPEPEPAARPIRRG